MNLEEIGIFLGDRVEVRKVVEYPTRQTIEREGEVIDFFRDDGIKIGMISGIFHVDNVVGVNCVCGDRKFYSTKTDKWFCLDCDDYV